MATKAFSIHGHFYQPPREDPLTGLIPNEPGAAPYNNWNEKILAECYQPNAKLGNFSGISFNIGPTLFPWLQSQDQETYHQILAQNQVNIQRHGVGNAIAQAYNHTILPLASSSDKAIDQRANPIKKAESTSWLSKAIMLGAESVSPRRTR